MAKEDSQQTCSWWPRKTANKHVHDGQGRQPTNMFLMAKEDSQQTCSWWPRKTANKHVHDGPGRQPTNMFMMAKEDPTLYITCTFACNISRFCNKQLLSSHH